MIAGVEVDHEGPEITHKGADERLHLIERGAIAGRCCPGLQPHVRHPGAGARAAVAWRLRSIDEEADLRRA